MEIYDETPEIESYMEKTEDCIEVEVVDSDTSDWQRRHNEIEAEREAIRQRVRNTRSGNVVIRPAKPTPRISDEGTKSVGVYARVSTKSTDQTSSIENQTMYYTQKVEETPNWSLHEIYSDEGKSGTSTTHRENFNRMIKAAANKEIDLIICASVSRFARNMSDCMTFIRQLKTMNPSHPVGVYFETENIYTLDPECNQNLSIHAMLADWESANKSRRMVLSYDQRICTGQYPVVDLLGYRHTKGGDLIVHPEEAKTVRFIFLAYISGYGYDEIAEVLTEKGRPTLKGRTDWNAGMVRSIMRNERRWGDLEARKTIVIDYVEHKSKKNDDERISAYAEGHHIGIVSPEIAKAAKLVAASARNLEGGVPEASVIPTGVLKGFVSVCPAWGGFSHKAFVEMSQCVYDDEELETLKRELHIWSGQEHSNILSMQLSGYEIPRGIFFLNCRMPSVTISKKQIQFSKACHQKLGCCRFVEVLYHPILQAIVLRETDENNPNAVAWEDEDGKIIGKISAPGFTKSIYENMQWRKDYRFRLRGITKKRGNQSIIIFALDEPQILLNKRQKDLIDQETEELNTSSSRYISYKEESAAEEVHEADETRYGYPKEWSQNRIGVNYAIRQRREEMISKISESDILQRGSVVENPMVGHIPTRNEIVEELEDLLMTM